MQNCTEYCWNAILHWLLFHCKIALNIVQMQQLAVQRCTACGSWWGEMELWRLPGSQLPMKMSDHFGAIINAIMHFKNNWCNHAFQKLSMQLVISKIIDAIWCASKIINVIMHFKYYEWIYAFQQSSMQLCTSTMVPWLQFQGTKGNQWWFFLQCCSRN